MEGFKAYPPLVAPMMKKYGGGYVAIKMGVSEDARGSEQAEAYDLAPVLEFPDRETLSTFFTSDEYAAIAPLRVENSDFSLVAFEANLLPDGFDTSAFGAYLLTLKKMTDPAKFKEQYPPLMKSNNEKFSAQMIARVGMDPALDPATIMSVGCQGFDFAVLIGFRSYEDAVNYIHDEEFGAQQTCVRKESTSGPLTIVNAANKTDGPFPQYTGTPHDR